MKSTKTTLITGASKRVGRDIALTLAEAGSDILIHYYRSRRDALQLKKDVESRGVRAEVFKADFSAGVRNLPSAIKRFVRDVYRVAGHVDLLVNNAAIFYPTPLGKITGRHWEDFMTVNLKSPFFLAQEIGMRMRRRKSGSIINLVDWTGLRPHPNYLPYAISKAGLIAATTGLAKALAPHVRVNCIAPGPILPANGATAKQKRAVIKKTLLKRFGNPKDISETVRYLWQGSDFVTGVMIPVDGGALGS